MKINRALRAALLAATALLLGGIPGGSARAGVTPMDYDAAVPCQAFHRSGYGAWTAIAPVTLVIDNGMSLSFAPGDSMGPGSTIAGVAVPIILDRHCGNR